MSSLLPLPQFPEGDRRKSALLESQRSQTAYGIFATHLVEDRQIVRAHTFLVSSKASQYGSIEADRRGNRKALR
jgi:hypothetical protein